MLKQIDKNEQRQIALGEISKGINNATQMIVI
jgi:hypothetical protein